MKKLIAVTGAALMFSAIAAPIAHASDNPVKATKSSIAQWVEQASTSAMTTRETAFDESVTTCKIAASQASDCIEKVPGNPDTQIVTNASASKKWFRDLPNGEWKSNKFAAGENPVANADRFFAYNPYEPWTAAAKLGVTWSMKKSGQNIIINSKINNYGDDQFPRTTVTISQNGNKFVLSSKSDSGAVMIKTKGTLRDSVTVVVPPN